MDQIELEIETNIQDLVMEVAEVRAKCRLMEEEVIAKRDQEIIRLYQIPTIKVDEIAQVTGMYPSSITRILDKYDIDRRGSGRRSYHFE